MEWGYEEWSMYCDISEGRRWSEKKVKESKYVNEVIIVKYICTLEKIGGEQRSEVVRESPYITPPSKAQHLGA